MGPINLTAKELRDVTGRRMASAQVRWFRKNGFTVLQRADGKPLISRAHFEIKMDGLPGNPKSKEYEPDYGALDAA